MGCINGRSKVDEPVPNIIPEPRSPIQPPTPKPEPKKEDYKISNEKNIHKYDNVYVPNTGEEPDIDEDVVEMPEINPDSKILPQEILNAKTNIKQKPAMK